MAYYDHFRLADDMIAHLDTVIQSINDPFIASRYVGFISVSAVTVYELAIKDIFCEFSTKKHKVFGNFTQNYFDRLNGRIKTNELTDNHLKRFGEKYIKRFKALIKKADEKSVRNDRTSILSCYNNVIQWRHDFAHKGIVPSNATYEEATKSYKIGKKVITCLAETMRR